MEREKDMVLAQKRGLYGLGSQKCDHADKVKGTELVTLSGEVWIGYTTREPRPHARCSSAVQPVPITYHNQIGYGPWMTGILHLPRVPRVFILRGLYGLGSQKCDQADKLKGLNW